MAQFDERAELLRPVARNTSADGENPQAFLAQQSRSEMFEIFKRIETNFVPAGAFAHTIIQRDVQPEFRIREGGHKNRNAFFVRGFQDPTLIFGTLRQMSADRM